MNVISQPPLQQGKGNSPFCRLLLVMIEDRFAVQAERYPGASSRLLACRAWLKAMGRDHRLELAVNNIKDADPSLKN